jgi:hypothetical protein
VLVSAGWLWHPVDEVRTYDIAAALGDPALLDGAGMGGSAWAEDCSAAFLPDGRLAVSLTGVEDDDGEISDATELRLFQPGSGGPASKLDLAEKTGTMMAIGTGHLLTLHTFPRLINIATGVAEQQWPHIHSGLQTSSILAGIPRPPTMAIDPTGQRCAIADASGITILQF